MILTQLIVKSLITCNGEFALGVLEAGDVGGAPGGREDDDEKGGGDQAVEDQHQEHHHVVGLEVVNILVQTLRQTTSTWGNLKHHLLVNSINTRILN